MEGIPQHVCHLVNSILITELLMDRVRRELYGISIFKHRSELTH